MPISSEQLLRHIESLEEQWMRDLQEIVEMESPTTDREAVNRVGAWVAERCRALGADIETEPSGQPDRGDHVIVRFPGENPHEKPILIIAHLDTVWKHGTLKEMPFRVNGNAIYGPGVFDMKGAVVFVLTALRVMRNFGVQPKRPIVCLFNSDEEMNSATSRPVIQRLAGGAHCALILEGGVGEAVITSRKGIMYFKVTAKGRSSHAGMDHEKGINAIEEIAHQILRIQKMTDYGKGTTLSCGIVQGGTRTNVVPAEAVVEVDARVPTHEEMLHLKEKMESLAPVLPGASVEVYTLIKRPPMDRTEGVLRLYEKAKHLAKELGFDLPEASTGAISDGNLTAAMGIPTLDGLGPVGDGAHAAHEHIDKDKIVPRLALLVRLMLEI